MSSRRYSPEARKAWGIYCDVSKAHAAADWVHSPELARALYIAKNNAYGAYTHAMQMYPARKNRTKGTRV